MDAMYRRFTDTCGAYCIDSKVQARKRLPVFLLRMIQKNIKFHTDVEIDIEQIVNALPPYNALVYTDIPRLENCNVKAVGSGEAGEALASPVFRPNSNISVLTFF